MPQLHVRLSLLTVLASLAACQAPTSSAVPPIAAASSVPQAAGVPVGRPAQGCPVGVRAVLSNGLGVNYDGAQRQDADICLARWQGVTHPYYLGFWGDGRAVPDAEERRAVHDVLSGPVGTATSFTAHGGKLWSRVSVTHVADPVLIIGGQPRPTVQLRRVLHDALGRSDVRAEALIWVDQATGIPLRRQTITRMDDGSQSAITTWEVSDLSMA